LSVGAPKITLAWTPMVNVPDPSSQVRVLKRWNVPVFGPPPKWKPNVSAVPLSHSTSPVAVKVSWTGVESRVMVVSDAAAIVTGTARSSETSRSRVTMRMRFMRSLP